MQHGGVDLKKRGEGDSHFAVFTKASDAAASAIAIQKALASTKPDYVSELKVRIAIHTGEAELRGDDYYGPALNRCGRMRAAAHGGQTILSDTTKKLIENALPKGITLKHLGMHRFKDLQEADRIYQLCSDSFPQDFPELRSLSAAKHNLPMQLTSFVGRERQIDAIRALLKDKRLITLIGAGGSGKTRLSQQIAAEVIEDFADGVWLVQLVSLQDGKLIAQRIAESLPISIGGRDSVQVIIDEYKSAHALLVLDNCEHLTKDAAITVQKLLQECPDLVFVATSREPLSVKGEYLFLVPPLECELHGKEATPESVVKLEAVQLFKDRAASRLSGENIITEKSAPSVAALCKKLDGIPLALEQAASNLNTLSPAQILDRLERHFSMLPIEEEGVDKRHRTIQATIDWSYGLLSEAERMLLERLSLFAGGWSLEAAEQICTGRGILREEALPLLDKLIKRSMVVAETAEWGDRRYRMLEPIRQFAERCRNPKEDARLKTGLLDWSFNFVREAYDVPASEQRRYLEILSAEHDNIRAALLWALTGGERAVDALKICVWLFNFWLNRGHVREGVSWIRRATDLAPNAPRDIQAKAMNVLGVLLWQSGDLEGAADSLEKSREIWQALGNRPKAAAALSNLGSVAFAKGDFKRAIEHYSAVADTFRAVSDLPRLAHALENLGVSHSKADNNEEALTHLEEAVKIHRQLCHTSELAKALDSYIGVFDLQGRLLQGRELFVEACGLAVESKNHFVFANLLEIGIRMCITVDDFVQGAQSYGAMALAVDRSERMVEPVRKERQAEMVAELTEKLGKDEFKRAVREGRALGPEAMISRLRDKLAAGE